ncbi:MAG: xanthine dehydrogenase family protein molybdopterin-binding subunit [Acidimicrobiia bacterium]
MTSFAPQAGRFVGQSVARKEDLRLVTGKGRYTDDLKLKDTLHVAFLRSDVARARITKLDVSAARTAPGVRHVFTAADLNPHVFQTMLPSLFADGSLGKVSPLRPLAENDVRFVGDPIVMVVADDRYLAEDACELIDLELEPLSPVVDYETAEAATERVHEEEASNVVSQIEIPVDPGLQQIFDEAAHTVTAAFRQHRYAHVPMENRAVVAAYDKHEKQLDIWIASQNPHEVRRAAGRTTGAPESRIRVRIGDVGGGFGQKSFVGREELTVVLAAYLAGGTFKWTEDRRENLIAGSHARVAKVTAKVSTDVDGRFLAAHVDHLEDTGAYPIGGGSASAGVCMYFPGPYRFPRLAWKSTTVWTNTCGRSAYRAPWMMETTAREQMVDVVARQIGIDPLELRRRNVIQSSELPYTTAMGQVIENVTPSECLEVAVKTIGYDEFRASQRAPRDDGRLIGIGLSLYIEPQPNMAAYANEPVNMRIAPDGHVDIYLASGAHGQGLETTTAQLVAEHLGVDVDDVTVHQGDTESTPFGPGTGGSRSGPMIGAAVIQASKTLRDRIYAIAAHLLEASADDLEMVESTVTVKGTPSKSITLKQIAQTAYHGSATLPAEIPLGLETNERYAAPATMYSNACHACTVAVDPLTGEVEVLRYVVAEDCGQMINPAIVEGQVAGGVIQGFGGVLYEENVYDTDGNPLATTFMDYLLPTSSEVPIIEMVHLESPASTPGAYKGVGEGGAIGAPSAIFNAVADALAPLGVELRDQPLTPDKLVKLIG